MSPEWQKLRFDHILPDMRNLIKALPLGLGLPLLIGIASVSPDDAVSNVSKWARLLGLHDVPAWLAGRVADPILILLAFGLATIYFFAVWGVPRHKVHEHARRLDELERVTTNLTTIKIDGAGAGENTLTNAIKIVFRPVPEFLPEQEFPAVGTVRRSVVVELENQGNGWLSGCLVEVTSIAPSPPPSLNQQHSLRALEPACVLNYGMSKNLTLLAYNRIEGNVPRQATYNDGPTIFYSVPGGYGGGAVTILSPGVRYLIRLRASAAESAPHEIDLRVWVDEGRVLQAEPI